jgi:hypothetical protein
MLWAMIVPHDDSSTFGGQPLRQSAALQCRARASDSCPHRAVGKRKGGSITREYRPLSANQISIFAVSTFDTDYVLIKEESWALALSALQAAGHQLTATPV